MEGLQGVAALVGLVGAMQFGHILLSLSIERRVARLEGALMKLNGRGDARSGAAG